ncbi:MAG: carboxypeptidase-like regulatory domain-containing protein, partial [Acidobacteriota bacterium]
MKQLILLLATCLAAFAQSEQARLVGTITDPSGAVLGKASLSVTDTKTGAQRQATASDQGYYVIPNLPASSYRVVATAAGFANAEIKDVPLSVGQERILDITMQPGTVTTSIEVTGELESLQTSSAAIGTNVNAREVNSLPINGRQISQLYLLTPGAQTAGGGSYDNIRFSGRANQQNAIRYDGVEASSIVDASPGNLNGETSTGFRLQSSLETVSEFRVDSSNFPAEYGTGTGGQISVVTKSGGNQIHGSLFEYLRNDAMDARNFFDGTTKAPLKLNQFGGSIGGPIKKDKLFFFAAYEGLKQRAGVNLLGTVPSTAARARAVASIQPLLAGYPTGAPTSNPDLDLARRSASNSTDENFGSMRLDYHLTDRFIAYLRYNRDQGYLQSPLDVSGSYSQVTSVPQNAVLGFQQVLSSSMV